MTAPRLEAFRVSEEAPELVPCTQERAWMDAFPDRHAYRCLPLSIANTHGWELLTPAAFEVEWNGGPHVADLTVRALAPFPAGLPLEHFAISNFARGIVTFHTGYLFRTPPGWNLLTTGAFNEPRPGIAPLTGIIESDWLPYPFTMNWQMLAPGTVRFEKDEVFCTVMPIPKNYLEQWEVAIHDLDRRSGAAGGASAVPRRAGGFPRPPGSRRPGSAEAGLAAPLLRRPPSRRHRRRRSRQQASIADPVDRSGTRPALAKADDRIAGGAGRLLKTAEVQPWRRGQPVGDPRPGQTDANRTGRPGLRDGVLTPTPATVAITPDMELDPEAFDFIYQPEFPDPGGMRLAGRNGGRAGGPAARGGHQDRVLARPDPVLPRRPRCADGRRRAHARCAAPGDRAAAALLRLTVPVFADTVQLVRWRTGMHMGTHADRANPTVGAWHAVPRFR